MNSSSRVRSLQSLVSTHLGVQTEPTIVDSLVRHIVSKINDAVRDFNGQIYTDNLNEHFIPYYHLLNIFISQVHNHLDELEKKASFSLKSLEDKYYVYQNVIKVLKDEQLENKIREAITIAEVDLQTATAQDVEEHRHFLMVAKRSLEDLYTLHERLDTVTGHNEALRAVVMAIDVIMMKFNNDNLSHRNSDENMIPFYKYLKDMIKRVNRYLKKLSNDDHTSFYGEVIRERIKIEGLIRRIKTAIDIAQQELNTGSVNVDDLQEYDIYLNAANDGLTLLIQLNETLLQLKERIRERFF